VAQDTDFWTSFLMTAAMTSIAVGINLDISWHESIGRDTFWTPRTWRFISVAFWPAA